MKISLTGNDDKAQDVDQMFMLTPGQIDVVFDIARLNSTSSQLSLMVRDRLPLILCTVVYCL